MLLATAGRVAAMHPGKLTILEVRIDPQTVRRNNGKQVGAFRHVRPDMGGAVAAVAVDRCAYVGVTEVQARRLQIEGHLRDRRTGP